MGIIMIASVTIPVKVFNRFQITKPLYKVVGTVKQQLGLYLNKKSNKSIFLIGFFNGFLPCGLVYMALIGAVASSNILLGASYMFLFGIGTIPMMTLAVYAGNILKLSLRNKIQKAIPVFVVIIGLLFILRGLGLGIPYISPSDTKLIISTNAKGCDTP
jgi:sulfite exporter TauE/SafE